MQALPGSRVVIQCVPREGSRVTRCGEKPFGPFIVVQIGDENAQRITGGQAQRVPGIEADLKMMSSLCPSVNGHAQVDYHPPIAGAPLRSAGDTARRSSRHAA